MADPALTVRQFGGDFSDWVDMLTVDAPEESLFAFRNDFPDLASTAWQLATHPMASDNASGAVPGLLGTGSFPAPKHGKARTFMVDWKAFVPTKRANGDRYYVRVVADRGPGTQPIVVSNTVVLTVNKSDFQVKFTTKGLGQTAKQQFPALFATSSMTVEVRLEKLYIANDNEDDDEPFVVPLVVWADGTTIDPLNMGAATVRIDTADKVHGNIPDHDKQGDPLEEGSTARIPLATGRFQQTIRPIGLDLAGDLPDPDGRVGGAIARHSAVYIAVAAFEEDSTADGVVIAARDAIAKALRGELERILRDIKLTDFITGQLPRFNAERLEQVSDKLQKMQASTSTPEPTTPLRRTSLVRAWTGI